MLALKGACKPGSDTPFELYQLLNEITTQMTIPLVQGLINALKGDDRDRVRLFGHAVVPLVSTCYAKDYEYLRASLLPATYNAIDSEKILERIFEILLCLGLTCTDIGAHVSDGGKSTCDSLKSTSFGYKPANVDDFKEVSTLPNAFHNFLAPTHSRCCF